MTAVVNGLRPVIPVGCPPGLARLMRACWDASPELRPSFAEIGLLLKDQYLLSTTMDDYTVLPAPSNTTVGTTASAPIYRRSSKDSIGSGSPPPQPPLAGYGTLNLSSPTVETREGGSETRRRI